MDQEFWNKIERYDLDHPLSEYGFSTRLARENYWTKNFTTRAIVEYKKFMYLAATSDLMVSPSAIVDTVWHQHLIFTQSYQDFCDVAGKAIQHVPSTHNSEDFGKFKQAKERTGKLYQSTFGEQPADIWEREGMYEGLSLDKAPIKIRTFVLYGMLVSAALIFPAYTLLRPVYVQIDSLDFLMGYVLLCVAVFTGLEIFNERYLAEVIRKIEPGSFLADLHPSELVYLKTQELSQVIHGVMNRLLIDRILRVSGGKYFEEISGGKPRSIEESQIMTSLGTAGKNNYDDLLHTLRGKPVFANVESSMEAFKKYFIKSVRFGRLFYINYAIVSLTFLAGFTRLVTGVMRDKPIQIITIALVVLGAISAWFLYRLTQLACKKTIPKIYRDRLKTTPGKSDGQWDYFLLGASILFPTFAPMVERMEGTSSSDGDSSDGGSSCGSSCSSCGGCGGGGD